MRQQRPILTLTVKASGAVALGRGVGFDGAQATAAGQKVLGVAQTTGADTKDFAVTAMGSAIVEAGGSFSAGAALAVDSQGRAVVASSLAIAAGATQVTSSAANGSAILSGGVLPQFVFADALEESSGAGAFVEVLLRR